jgi:hypothetical protein
MASGYPEETTQIKWFLLVEVLNCAVKKKEKVE